MAQASAQQANAPLHATSALEAQCVTAIAEARTKGDREALVRNLALLGGALLQSGERIKALPYFHEAVTRGGNHLVQSLFCQCIGKIRFAAPRPQLKPLLTRAFNEVWIRPADIMRVAANLLFHEPAFKQAALQLDAPFDRHQWLAQATLQPIATDPLLLALMRATMVMDTPLELILTRTRHALLEACRASEDVTQYNALIIALAHQSFANEYAFFVSDAEKDAVTALEVRIAESLKAGTPPDAHAVMLLAAYTPLIRTAFADALMALPWDADVETVIARQLREPRQEIALRAAIPCITPLTDAVSHAVRNQYEENPYPRWVEAPRHEGSFSLTRWLRTFFPDAPHPELVMPSPYSILVAGCGTGQQSVNAALRFADSTVLAVDLSLASLGYAVRKTKEFGLKNIEYAHGDLLELRALNRQFDMVECGGVLHHLAEPLKGWKVLTDITKPGGYQSIALYSERARKYLEPVRDYAKEHGFGTSEEELRRFRATIFALPHNNPAAQIALRRDFYSLSMLRDLAFHVQEHRFTPKQLGDAMAQLGLEFLGFNLPPESKRQFCEHFSTAANLLSLDQWETFEEAYPETFAGMYQFLARKPG